MANRHFAEQLYDTVTQKESKSTFLYGLCLDARHFFTGTFGAHVELDYGVISMASVGLPVKL